MCYNIFKGYDIMERIKIGYLRKNNIPKETTDLCRLLLSKKRDNYINQIVLYFPKELFNLIIKDCLMLFKRI